MVPWISESSYSWCLDEELEERLDDDDDDDEDNGAYEVLGMDTSWLELPWPSCGCCGSSFGSKPIGCPSFDIVSETRKVRVVTSRREPN